MLDRVRAPLIEVFHSIQGEGRFVGMPMVFVRVATCPLRCSYCDTVSSYVAPARATLGAGAAARSEANPVTAARTAELVREVAAAAGPVRLPRVSITGGEPLVFPAFVRGLGRLVRGEGGSCHLETAAIDAAALAQCIDQVDHVSADYKLPSTLAGQDHGAAHVGCCEVALAAGRTLDVKIVLTATATDAEFDRALHQLAPFAAGMLLVLQPVTPCLRATAPLPTARLERFVAVATERFDVRVLPQVHKVLQIP